MWVRARASERSLRESARWRGGEEQERRSDAFTSRQERRRRVKDGGVLAEDVGPGRLREGGIWEGGGGGEWQLGKPIECGGF